MAITHAIIHIILYLSFFSVFVVFNYENIVIKP